jgi:hypothetical protein
LISWGCSDDVPSIGGDGTFDKLDAVEALATADSSGSNCDAACLVNANSVNRTFVRCVLNSGNGSRRSCLIPHKHHGVHTTSAAKVVEMFIRLPHLAKPQSRYPLLGQLRLGSRAWHTRTGFANWQMLFT